jgi:DNA-directed RNA polymerase specialized sigma24 family protein
VLEPLPDTGPDVDDTVADDERRTLLWRAIRRLSPRCQQLMQVIAFAERPDYAAISAAMSMPKGSIGPTRGRCLARLRAILQTEPGWGLA